MAVPLDQLPLRQRAAPALAHRLSALEYDRLAPGEQPAALTAALADTVREFYDETLVEPLGGLSDWLPFADAAEALAKNLATPCAAGALGRYLAGVPDASGWSYARVFADSTANLFDNLDQLADGAPG